jgi:hypothetical protein
VSSQDIPDEVKAFIYKNISSLEQLEVLLYLHHNLNKEYDARTIADELRTNPESVENRLQDFVEKDLVIITDPDKGLYQYKPLSGNNGLVIRQLEKAYQDLRHTVINLIFSKPLDNIRSFADSFKLRKDNPDG